MYKNVNPVLLSGKGKNVLKGSILKVETLHVVAALSTPAKWIYTRQELFNDQTQTVQRS